MKKRLRKKAPKRTDEAVSPWEAVDEAVDVIRVSALETKPKGYLRLLDYLELQCIDSQG